MTLREFITEASGEGKESFVSIYDQFRNQYKNFDIEKASERELREFIKEFRGVTDTSTYGRTLSSPKATKSGRKNAVGGFKDAKKLREEYFQKVEKAKEKLSQLK